MHDRPRCVQCGRELKVVGRIKHADGTVTMLQRCPCGLAREDDVSSAVWASILHRMEMPSQARRRP